MNLNDKALLVQLSISTWTARKYDKRVSKEANHAFNASESAGRFNKALLPAADILIDVSRKAGAIRNKFYANTLPWSSEGTALLPTANYLGFMTDFRTEKSEWERLVSKFVRAYPDLVEEARYSLGDMFNDNDYPSQHEIGKRFNIDIAVSPVPTSDFRVDVTNEEMILIQQDVEQRVQKAQAAAMREVWDRLHKRVSHMADRLSDTSPDQRQHQSTVDNVKDVCEMLKVLNVMDDPDLEAMRQEVEQKLTRYDIVDYKDDPVLRQATAATAKDIIDRMSVFMNGL
jgi:hypothetical protein